MLCLIRSPAASSQPKTSDASRSHAPTGLSVEAGRSRARQRCRPVTAFATALRTALPSARRDSPAAGVRAPTIEELKARRQSRNPVPSA